MIRKTVYVKIEANGLNEEGEEVTVALTSELKAETTDVDGVTSDDIRGEIHALTAFIEQTIEISIQNLNAGETKDFKRFKKEEKSVETTAKKKRSPFSV